MVRVREATAADEGELRRLEESSPQGTVSRLSQERTTFFYRTQLFPTARVLLAEEGSQAVGFLAYALKEVFLGGEVTRVAYFYDLRSDSQYRRTMRRGLWDLWKAAEEGAQRDGAELLYGHVKGDNVRAMRVFLKGGAQSAGEFHIVTLPSRPGRAQLFPLSDPLAAAEEFEKALGNRDFQPPRLPEIYAHGQALGYLRGVFRLERGQSFAQVSLWDSSRVHQERVLSIPWEYRILGRVVNPLARFLPVPRIPVPGQALRFWHLFDVWVGGAAGPRLLGRILTDLSHQARAEGVDLLALFHGVGDPLVRLPRVLLKETLAYRTLYLPFGSTKPQPPLYLDIRDL